MRRSNGNFRFRNAAIIGVKCHNGLRCLSHCPEPACEVLHCVRERLGFFVRSSCSRSLRSLDHGELEAKYSSSGRAVRAIHALPATASQRRDSGPPHGSRSKPPFNPLLHPVANQSARQTPFSTGRASPKRLSRPLLLYGSSVRMVMSGVDSLSGPSCPGAFVTGPLMCAPE